MRRIRRAAALLVVALGLTPAHGLTDEEVFRNFRFNLINPGARALALGGAFVSLADDATAAQANPAGLSFLRRWELFAETRSVDNAARSSISQETLSGGRNTFVAVGTDLADVVRPTFVSGVLTFERWTLGLSRQESLRARNDTVSSFALTFADAPGAFLAEGTGSIAVDVVNLNVGAGFRITDRLALGATLTRSELDVRSEVVNLIVDTGGGIAGESILEPALDLRTAVDDSDRELTFSIGIIYKKVSKWGLGLVYRQGPDFAVEQGVGLPLGDGGGGRDVFGVTARVGSRLTNRFSLPDVIALGGSWFPTDRWTLAVDVEHVRYSNLLEQYVAGVNVLTDFDARFTVDDGLDVRAGAEYILFNLNNPLPPLALRGGAFVESDSSIRAVFTGTTNFASERVFAAAGDTLHVAVGAGLNFKRYKVDLAADISETDNEYVLSLIYQGK